MREKIRTVVSESGLTISANLQDGALPALVQLIQDNRDDSASTAPIPAVEARAASSPGGASMPGSMLSNNNEQAIKDFLRSHGAAELLNRLKWDSFPEKILLLGAWHEARGGTVPWRSADMDDMRRSSRPRKVLRGTSRAISRTRSSPAGYTRRHHGPTHSPARAGTASRRRPRIWTNERQEAQSSVSRASIASRAARCQEVADASAAPRGHRSGEAPEGLPERAEVELWPVRGRNGTAPRIPCDKSAGVAARDLLGAREKSDNLHRRSFLEEDEQSDKC